jgi:ADP-ribose pyrophosphatase YjhB (NUDIX family)
MDFPTPPAIVQAAGGLIFRRQADQLQILLVHRPLQEDWTYPKGKLEEGETLEEAARREVLEETGLSCRLLRLVGQTEYIDRKGRPKVVSYWVMLPEHGAFVPNDEVDEVQWLDLPAAERRLSYDRDRELLAALAAGDQLQPLFDEPEKNWDFDV